MLLSCSKDKISVIVTQYTDPVNITGIAPYKDAIYCSTKGGLVKWELPERKYTVYTTIDGLPSNILNDVIVDKEERLWIGSMDGIVMFDGKVWKRYGLSHGLPSVEINDLGLDKNGVLWVATAAGIASFEQSKFKQLRNKAFQVTKFPL